MGFPKQIYDKASQILADRRQKANEQGRLQKEAIYSALPEVAKIDRQLAQTGMATIRAVAAAPPHAASSICSAKNTRVQRLLLVPSARMMAYSPFLPWNSK